MGIYLSDQERDCLTNLRFADDVMLFATSKGQIQNMMCEFKEATEKVGLTIHPNKTKILSNESSMNSDTKRYIKIGDMDIEILAKSESVKYLGQRIIQTKRKYKKIEKQVVEHTIEEGNDDKTENCSTDDKSGDDQSIKSEDDMDSGVTFDEDSEKDIDTAEIEEEDWFDYIRRSTADAIDKMEHAKIRCWNRTHRKMKWKLALRIATSPSERWIKKAAEWNPELSSKYRTNRTIGRPKRDGKMTSMISSNKIMMKERLMNHMKERFKTITCGSILPLTGKNGLDLKKNTQ